VKLPYFRNINIKSAVPKRGDLYEDNNPEFINYEESKQSSFYQIKFLHYFIQYTKTLVINLKLVQISDFEL
jgi:signal peptidase I